MPDFSAVAVALCLVSGPSPCTEIFFAGQRLPLLQEKTARLCLQSCHLSRARLLGVALTGVMWGFGGGEFVDPRLLLRAPASVLLEDNSHACLQESD